MKGTYIFDEKTGEFLHVDNKIPEQTPCKCGCGKMVDTVVTKSEPRTGQYL